MGSRRIWNALTPTIAPASRSRTYAFMPWMTATTATRNATETMMPSSVKNERSLWLQIVSTARTTASKSGTVYKLLVSERLDGIQSRGPTGGIQTEADAGQRRREERRDD